MKMLATKATECTEKIKNGAKCRPMIKVAKRIPTIFVFRTQ